MSIERLRALEKDIRNSGGPGCQYHADQLASLIAELGQEVAPVAWPSERVSIADPHDHGYRIVGFKISESHPWHGKYGLSEPLNALDRAISNSPAHTSEARDAARYRALKTHFQAKFHRATCDYWVIVGELKTDPRFIGEDGEQLTLDNALDAVIAAMRQEGGND